MRIMNKLTAILIATGVLLSGPPASKAAFTVTFTSSEYDNANPPTSGFFRDFLDEATSGAFGTHINQGNRLGTGSVPHTALNFTATVGASGGSGITLYDTTPHDGSAATQTLFTGSIKLSADILFANGNNIKDVGVLSLFNEGSGQKGLALLLREAGSTDRARLSLVTQDDVTSGTSPLASVPASGSNSAIALNNWYRLTMDLVIVGDAFSVTGMVFPHTTPTNPASSLGAAISALTLTYSGSLAAQGLSATGQVGLAADYVSTSVNASVTNFTVDGQLVGAAVPESMSLIVWTLVLGSACLAGRRPRD
jgi:hypothetical protein